MSTKPIAIQEIDQMIQDNKNNPYPKRKVRLRIVQAAEIAVKHFKGDLVEIGAMTGLTTMELCRIARENDRKVVVVDPWIAGTQNCSGKEYEKFRKNTAGFEDLLTVLKMRSDAPPVKEYLEQIDIAFSFVDGLHTPEMMYQDVMITKHAEIICCDDIGYPSLGLLDPYIQLGEELNKLRLYCLPLREGYLI